jgi:hypothetical protein
MRETGRRRRGLRGLQFGAQRCSVASPLGGAGGEILPRSLTDKRSAERDEVAMATVLIFHDVDNVDHWLSSPKREEVFGPSGITVRTFRGTEGSKQVGLIAEIPDMAVWQEILQSEAGTEAMKYDGVHPETIVVLTEG